MNPRWILVDGYSVLHFWRTLIRPRRGRATMKSESRDMLIRLLRQYSDARGCRVSIIFDGYGAKHHPETADHGVGIEVVYSPAGKTADDVIERSVAEAENRPSILVVTSDNLERQTVESLGAHSMSAELFESEVETALVQLGHLVRQHHRSRTTR